MRAYRKLALIIVITMNISDRLTGLYNYYCTYVAAMLTSACMFARI